MPHHLTARQQAAYAALDAVSDEAAAWTAQHGPRLPYDLWQRLYVAADEAVEADLAAPIWTPDNVDDLIAQEVGR